MRTTLLLVLAIAGCGNDPVLAGKLPPREYGGLMFFQGASRAQPMELHYTRLSGGTAEPVNPPLIGGGGAALSRDGDWIAWVDGARIRIRHLRSHSAEFLTSSRDYVEQPRWSPEGRYLLFVRRPDAGVDWTTTRRQLVLFDRVTGHVEVLSVDASTIRSPDWSPRGDYLVWHRLGQNQIELATLRGEVVRILSPDVDSVSAVSGPVFSPDGRQVAFVEQHPYPIDHSAVAVVALEGGVITRVALAGLAGGLAWSPSGEELAACVNPALGDSGYGDERVDVINLETGATRTASGEGMIACSPMWGPR